jgi:hypothetical protein
MFSRNDNIDYDDTDWKTVGLAANQKIAELEQQRDELLSELIEYGEHQEGCYGGRRDLEGCACGYRQTVNKYKARGGCMSEVERVVMRTDTWKIPVGVSVVVSLKHEVGEFTGKLNSECRFEMDDGGILDGYWQSNVAGWRYA